jgi:CHAD domain-containing protein
VSPERKRGAVPADLLARSAEEAVRRLALAELERAEAARERLVAGDRDEALHDLRVALRRLRSLLRSHRAEFSLEFPKKLVRRLGDLASSTNPGRDAEVQVAWLAPLAGALRPAERAGHLALLRQLEERRDDCYRKVEREIVRDFGDLAAALRERLSSYRVEIRLDRPAKAPTFAAATLAALGRGEAELREKLVAVHAATDETEAHDARIAAKRLRYLIEPVVAWATEGRAPVKRLKDLQDHLGELHDCQLLAAHVAGSLAELESRRAQELVEATLGGPSAADARPRRPPPSRERTGLLAVARALGTRRNELFTAVASGWLGEHAPELMALRAELARLEERLAAPASSWRRRNEASARRRRS